MIHRVFTLTILLHGILWLEGLLSARKYQWDGVYRRILRLLSVTDILLSDMASAASPGSRTIPRLDRAPAATGISRIL